MSCDDVLKLSDLEIAKKHDNFHTEVITGKSLATGANIDHATNAVTGQLQKTLPKAINELGGMGYARVGTFKVGATLTTARQTLLWDIADGGDGQEYGWSGAFPKVVPADSTPDSTGGIGEGKWVSRFDPELRDYVLNATAVTFKNEFGYSAVENMIAGRVKGVAGAVVHRVGNIYSTGGTTWRVKATSSPAVTDDFIALNSVNVKDFGAVGDGVVDDYQAMMAALNNSDFVYLPDGTYKSSSDTIDYWRFFGTGKVSLPTQAVEVSNAQQGTALHKSYKQTYGRFEQAAASSVVANPTDQTYTNTQVNGTDARGLARDYPGRDHVAQFIWARGFAPVLTTPASTNYTARTITAPEIAAYAKPNMIIETVGPNKATTIVERVEGNTAYCTGWFTATEDNVTPSNGTGATLNPINKLFGQNIVISPENAPSTPVLHSAGTEYNIFTQGTEYNPGVRGIDVSFEPGGGGGDVGVMVRGKRNIGFYSYDSDVGTGAEIGFYSKGDKRGLFVSASTVIPIEVANGAGASVFAVNKAGEISQGPLVRGVVQVLQASTGGTTISDVVFSPNYGARFTIWGFNVVGGARFRHEIIANGSGVTVIGGADDTGAGVSYSVFNQRQLVIKTTSGTVQCIGSVEYTPDGV